MNKSAIQKYAIWARTEMIAQVEQRAYQYGITADGYGEENAVTVQGRALSNQEQEQRWELIQQIKHKGYTQVMEEVAYTWFNRFIALRFMEVNNYLPTHIRVFSDSTGAFKPEILSSAMQSDLEGLDRTKVAQMIDANQTEELYRYLLLTQCNALNEALPKMFEKMGGYTEILLPNNILRADGVLGRMVNEIPEEDWTDQVQIIGWLYQYYNAELKDETFALLKKNVKITKERIPSATQLFTPDWIVRYMVENSLGRLWVEGHPDDALKAEWKYYLEEAEQELEVQEQLKHIRAEYATLTPQDIKVIDPCMGSGHILVYAFDVLVQIYKASGYSERDAAKLILENNLYGLDIDDRAAQLAYFAVMMKARQYDRRIFSRGVQPNVFAVQESNNINRRHLKFFGYQMSDLERNLALNQLNAVLDEFNDAKEYGSILNITKQDWELLHRFVQSVDYSGQMTLEAIGLEDTRETLFELLKIAAIMAQRFDVAVTNPPYMGQKGMNSKLDDYLKKNYFNSKSDLFSAFSERLMQYTCDAGYVGMMTPNVWMFITSYQHLRGIVLETKQLLSLVQLSNTGFADAAVSICTFVFVNRQFSKDYRGAFIRLKEYEGPTEQEIGFLEKKKRAFTANGIYSPKSTSFFSVEGCPLTFWVSDAAKAAFTKYKPLTHYASPKQGMATMDTDRFLKMWHEVEMSRVSISAKSLDDAAASGMKWFPIHKGGPARKWFGNNTYVVNWYNDGAELKENAASIYGSYTKRIYNTQYFFKEGATWSAIAYDFAIRYFPQGYTFSNAGMAMFASHDLLVYLIALLNSKLTKLFLSAINESVNFNQGDIAKVPVCYDTKRLNQVLTVAERCVEISKEDWDSFEESWDFQYDPLIDMIAKGGSFFDVGRISLEECYKMWESECTERFNQLKVNEEELNRIFIDIYGLQDELNPEVEDKDVTVRKADLGRDVRSLISYAVGCMFGRYSLNVPGLAYAGGQWDASKYSTIIPEKDNILPICDDDYFDDDITVRFIRWVETVYGKDTLEENLKFIANALGGKGQPREVIRNYFLNDFYADHLKVYQKRPIYWLFDSGKKNGFKALIYMHRYQSDLLARMRTDYVHEMQERYRTQLTHLNDSIANASTSERVKLNKQLKKIQDQALELQKYEEKIHHLADRNISIDLDDGVKHNYALFGDVLAKIK